MMRVGQRVICGVYVLDAFVPMHVGDIVRVHDGYVEVDVMSLHGGAPWIRSYTFGEIRLIEEKTT